MSESPEGEEIREELDFPQPVGSDEEDDCEGYFLEPVGTNVNIAEKIAEANKRLLEEVEEYENRPRKVQFCEDLVNFEPVYYSDDEYTESAQNSIISEEDSDFRSNQNESEKAKTENDSVISTNLEKESEEKKSEDEIPEELDTEIISVPQNINSDLSEKNQKFILVLLPKEQNSSCESIIGDEISEEKKEIKYESEKFAKPKIVRPKSAKKSCEVSKISPNLSYSSNMERRSWQSSRNPLLKAKSKVEGNEKKDVFVGEIKVQIKGRLLKKINIHDLSLENVPKVEKLKRCGCSRPKSSYNGRSSIGGENRPKTAPMRRSCCVIKTELPQYNGLRSEYGLSAEQLQERKQKALECRQKKIMEKMKKKQEELRKKNENEETFQKWLFNKTQKNLKKKSPKVSDTLIRSDVYIQTHASYATNRGVPYSMDYSISKKTGSKKRDTRGKKNKTVLVEKLLSEMTPHFKRSFNIYLKV